MSEGHDRVVRQLQQRLEQGGTTGAADMTFVLPQLQRRIRRLRSLGSEYDAVRVSKDVVKLCPSESGRCAGCA